MILQLVLLLRFLLVPNIISDHMSKQIENGTSHAIERRRLAKTSLLGHKVHSVKDVQRNFQELGPDLQCLLKVKEDLSLVLIFQDAKNNVSNWFKTK